MNELVDIYIDGEKHKAMVIKAFELEGREFCIYAVPNGDGNFGLKAGKKLGDQVVDIEDDNEKTVVENIIKTILFGQKKEEFLNMNDEEAKFTVKDENGVEKNAYIIGKFNVKDKDYVAYAVEEKDDSFGIYVKEIIYNENGEEVDAKSIENPDERDFVFSAIRDLINEEVGES